MTASQLMTYVFGRHMFGRQLLPNDWKRIEREPPNLDIVGCCPLRRQHERQFLASKSGRHPWDPYPIYQGFRMTNATPDSCKLLKTSRERAINPEKMGKMGASLVVTANGLPNQRDGSGHCDQPTLWDDEIDQEDVYEEQSVKGSTSPVKNN
ncbi:hypothetical protein Tco_0839185 [Tanacetum coccineum]|uniref:Uncharacterized protein n=1 Tax=Tanacetum coccineum TaxID=301880 RepID=A0ABQ5ATW4_9ASTR